MKTPCVAMVLALLLSFSLSMGCIPATPPADEATAPEKAAPAPVAEPKEEPPSEEGVSKLRVSLGAGNTGSGAGGESTIALVAMEETVGFTLQGHFPVEGIAIEGSLLHQEEGKWLLSGKYISSIDSFKPGPPAYQAMGILQSQEGGGLKVTDSATEGLLLFSAPMPNPASADLSEAREFPFELIIETPVYTIFNAIVTPF